MKRVVFLLAAIAACVLCLCAFGSKVKVFSDNFDRPERFARYWNHNAGEVPGTVEYLPGGGADGGGCVKIASAEKTALAIKHKLTGLHPGKLYRLSALMKCDSVQDGRGAVLYLDPEGLEQSWNASEFAYGTNDWTEVYMDFVPDRQGEAVVCCGLGFPWGTYNGGKASGTVWYDNVKVTPAPEEALYTREGEHIVLKLDRDKVTVSDADIDAWLSKLDRTYEAYRDLVGDVPFDGRKIMILNTPGIEPGYWALAGNPILWNSHVAVSKLLDRTVEFGDWGFGIIHEIGHVFSQGNISGTGRWNWNDEIFANFRMSYALEACDGTMSQRDICYRGADVINYYKIFYDETIGAGIPKNNGDALHYTFLRIKERYGWDVYKKAFRELYALGDSGQEGLETPYDKFLFFLSYVSKAAGEDVVAATYTPGELALIEVTDSKDVDGVKAILQARIDEVVHHLVDAGTGQQEVGVDQQVAHAVGVLGQAEEVSLFLSIDDRTAAVRAAAVDQLTLGPEALTGGAVLALVGALVDVAVVVHLLEDLLDGLDMVVIRCADEAVVRNIHELPQIEDALFAADDVVDELLRGHARGLGLVLDLLAVLVGAGQEHDVIACQALVARHRVGRYGAVGVADVELVGGIVDGGRDIEFLLVHWCFPLFCPRRMKAGRNYLQSTTERAVFARFYRIFPQKKKARRHKHRTFSI